MFPDFTLLSPANFPDYELIDSGNFEKLERFGNYILSRPEPQALWDKSLPAVQWENQASALFKKDLKNPEKGQWFPKKNMPERWQMTYPLGKQTLTFKLALSAFKHIGIFPEQAVNWDFIFERTTQLPVSQPKVLNLFAYTGIASLAARLAGAEVAHIDSVKQVITWARENTEMSRLDGIRWLVEDVMKFVQREVRRGNLYQGIILDPPAYGRGPEGEKWLLEEHLNELLKNCQKLLDPTHHFFVLNLYSLGFSALIAENLIQQIFPAVNNPEFGELYLEDSFQKKLPLGIFYRFYQ